MGIVQNDVTYHVAKAAQGMMRGISHPWFARSSSPPSSIRCKHARVSSHDDLGVPACGKEWSMWQSKSDSALERDVREELAFDPRVDVKAIAVSAKGGVVTLSGSAPTFAAKLAACRDAERVSGVNVVVEHMDVTLPDMHARNDADLAKAVADALRWDVEVPHGNIKTSVRDGWITLEGTVEWQYQRAAADGAVRYLVGVKGVTNQIAVAPSPAKAIDVKQHIKDALTRSAEADAQHITVDTMEGGSVTLRGKIHSWAEREEVVRAAWATPGVRKVQDELIYA
jgi:osmotically-inducible protein OsmY